MEEIEFFTVCDVTGRQYHTESVRRCPHPNVIRKYGFHGKCNVSVYVCKKCRFGQRDLHMDAYGCAYQEGITKNGRNQNGQRGLVKTKPQADDQQDNLVE